MTPKIETHYKQQ